LGEPCPEDNDICVKVVERKGGNYLIGICGFFWDLAGCPGFIGEFYEIRGISIKIQENSIAGSFFIEGEILNFLSIMDSDKNSGFSSKSYQIIEENLYDFHWIFKYSRISRKNCGYSRN
jgi:hypothetical protein